MFKFISQAINKLNSALKQLQVKSIFAVVLAGFLFLTTTANSGSHSRAATHFVDNALRQNDTDRPQTTGEWNKEARETEDEPGERLKRIASQSAEAVKEFGSVYPDTAERSARSLDENTK